jgi:hypothetical protein
MPPKATKKWGQFNKDLLAKLTHWQLINITNTTLENIKQVRLAHFWHCNPLNFCQNFRDYLASFDLEIEYSGARRSNDQGKLRRLFLLILSSIRASSNALPPPPPIIFSA